MAEWILAADLGGTKMTAALVDPAGRFTLERTCPTQAADGIETVTRRFAALLQDILAAAGNRPPRACGIASLGLIAPASGDIRYAANIPGARDYPLGRLLQDALALPVVVDNDIRLHALGEHTSGAAQGVRDFLFVAAGTGVGGALFLDGRPYRGAHDAAGEIGHITLDGSPDAPPCACGRRGCLETFAAGPAMVAHFWRGAATLALPPAGVSLTLADISRWLPDPGPAGALARETITRGAAALGRGLAIAANLLDPQQIILGGGVANLGPPWLAAVHQAMAAHTLPRSGEIRLGLARLGDKAALTGAAVLDRQHLEQTNHAP